jgi:cytochrome c553
MQRIRFSTYALLFAVASLAMFWPDAGVYAGNARLWEIRSDPNALRAAREAGRKISFFCANCHGDNGVSNLPTVPNLAGQNADYLLEQTRKFGTGDRKEPFMQGLIKVLREEEIIQMSLFYASQNPRPGKPSPASVEAGKRLFTVHCVRCHGEKARGDELIPRLAGQHKEYLVESVSRYRNKSGERQDPQMSASVAPLTDANIRAVAAYLNSLP